MSEKSKFELFAPKMAALVATRLFFRNKFSILLDGLEEEEAVKMLPRRAGDALEARLVTFSASASTPLVIEMFAQIQQFLVHLLRRCVEVLRYVVVSLDRFDFVAIMVRLRVPKPGALFKNGYQLLGFPRVPGSLLRHIAHTLDRTYVHYVR